MKKKIFFRSLWGAPLGIAISFLISIIISLIMIRDGQYYPVHPALVTEVGSEINAVLLQTVCAAIYGMICAGASVIWEAESWSMLRMTVTHSLVISLSTLPIAWFMRWMAHDIKDVIIYFAIFFVVYAIIWFSQYASMKKHIQQLNQKLQN